MDRRILVVEPQCTGFAHAGFNAALLRALSHAFPDEGLRYCAEADHIAWVRRSLEAQAGHEVVGRVEWEPVSVPSRAAYPLRIAFDEAAWTRRLVRELRQPAVIGAVVCSIAGPSLFALKPALYAGGVRKPVLALVHGVLATLHEPGRTVLHRIAHLRVGLGLPHPPCLRFVALSDSIQDELARSFPRYARHFAPIDAPYFLDAERPSEPDPAQQVRFGYFGVSNRNKGFERFLTLARAFRETGMPGTFVQVGFVRDRARLAEVRELLPDAVCDPLSEEAFVERARSVTYAVWTGTPAHYRLTCSASFLDALSFAKPGVYLRNPYVAHYADRMGDIGYLCDTMEALTDQAFALARAVPLARYRAQQDAIIAGRVCFAPERTATRLRAVWNELHGDLQPTR